MAWTRRTKRAINEPLIVVSGKITKTNYDKICEIAYKERTPLADLVERGIDKLLEQYGTKTVE